ncbi:hypothetical protein [uncultured Desulfobacter sp.]|uniref:hypothetical protein n=1 Tax=uncultured Desulfobacter sp. TaxID=240139 RepID=UPI0029F5937A|nr:hypothetical protein [uncultured Desulfobacter sp.]
MSLREVVIELQVDFEGTFYYRDKADWKMIRENNKKLDEHLEKLNMSIREHIYGKIK